MPPLRKPRPSAQRPGAPAGRFSDTFASRPAVPRRGLVPGVRVWATVGAAAGLTVVAALAVPLLSHVDLFPAPDTTPAAVVAAGEPTTLSSASQSPSPSSSPTPSHNPSHKSAKTTSGGSGSGGGTGSGSTGQQSGGGSVSSGSNSGSTSSGSKSSGSKSSSSGTSSSGKSSSSSGGTTKPPTVPGVRLIGTGSGRCIDVTNAGGDGTRLQILDCSGAAKQKWVFQSDGTIRSLGLCMDLAWGNSANGTAVQVANCSGNRAQLFYLSSAGDLVSALADKCVDVPDNGTGNGTKLQLWTCSGTANQKWHKG